MYITDLFTKEIEITKDDVTRYFMGLMLENLCSESGSCSDCPFKIACETIGDIKDGNSSSRLCEYLGDVAETPCSFEPGELEDLPY